MPTYLPANPYVTSFDFRVQFDLTVGQIKIDLSPSVISDASGIKQVSVMIQRPDTTVADMGGVFTPANINTTYTYNIPKIQNIYMWGLYVVTCTLTMTGPPLADYPLSKKRNICAPDSKNPYSTDIPGSIQLSVDCAMGTLTARGLCGYGYMSQVPASETYNVTRYYPPEAELLPQKNLSVVPFVVDAYVGVNKVKGVNISRYDYGDNVFAIVRVVGEEEINIRCGIDYDSIYCGMRNLLKTMDGCNATQADYSQAFGEINALLWTATVGINENKDVSDLISRLEELLGVECHCAACAGEKVGPVCVPACPQVTDIRAIVDDTDQAQSKLKISFDSSPLPGGSKVQIQYRPFCNPGANDAFTQIADTDATGGVQTVSINIDDAVTYQAILTTVMPDGSYCDSVVVTAPGNCAQVVDINVPPPKPPQVKFRADWTWQTAAITDATTLTWQTGSDFDKGADIRADFTTAPDRQYLALRYPKTEAVKTTWYNSFLNNGQIPDQVFMAALTSGDYVYIWSRVPVALQSVNKVILFS